MFMPIHENGERPAIAGLHPAHQLRVTVRHYKGINARDRGKFRFDSYFVESVFMV